MKRLHSHLLLCAAAVLTTVLGSCTKDIIEEQRAANSLLNIVTRAGDTDDDGSTAVKTGRIYIFDDEERCVSVLNIDETTQDATTKLPAGTYSVYAVGGFDVDRMSLPAQADAKPDSELQLLSDKVMDDLLLQHTEAMTLNDGDDRTLTLTLERQVLRLDQVTIKQVPDDVTRVEVVLEPFYKTVRLDGTFPTETETIATELTSLGEGKWQAEPQLYHFPSKGKPVITVRFTRPTGTKSFSYTAAEELPANHKVKIEGTYTQKEGVNITGVLTGSEWGEDKIITFEFDNESATGTDPADPDDDNTDPDNTDPDNNDPTPSTPTDTPEVGSFYQGCYVLSVNGNNATLVSPSEAYSIDVTKGDNAAKIETINNYLSSSKWNPGDDVTVSGTWRIPTEDEARAFLVDPTCVTITGTKDYFCLNNGELMAVTVTMNYATQSQTIKNTTSETGLSTRLRPVIDITLP